MQYVANDIYPPLNLGLTRPLLTIGLCAAAIGGYYAVRWLRVQLALRRQRRLAELNKPKKDEIIARALSEIQRIENEVLAGSTATDVGAAQVSAVTRGAFDALMNHTTLRQAKYEIAARNLQTLTGMLDAGYPVAFNPPTDRGGFPAICNLAKKVIEACR